MMKRKLITKKADDAAALKAFEKEVNDLLEKNWMPLSIDVEHSDKTTICVALLAKPTRCECECACCAGEATHDTDCDCSCNCCAIHNTKLCDDYKE